MPGMETRTVEFEHGDFTVTITGPMGDSNPHEDALDALNRLCSEENLKRFGYLGGWAERADATDTAT